MFRGCQGSSEVVARRFDEDSCFGRLRVWAVVRA